MNLTGNSQKPSLGFTLLEVLTVMAVIAALAAIAVPQYQSYIRQARASACLANRRHIELAEQEQFLRTHQADLSIAPEFRCSSGGQYVWIYNDPADPRYPKIGCSVHA
jgi:prepilin-type N-terminal cleavage/methylation domain-containing protein